MSWSKKINSKTYAIGSLANVGAATIFGYPNFQSIIWLIVVLIGAIINHYSSVYVIGSLIEAQMTDLNAPINKRKLAFFLVMKIASLIIAFALLVSFARPLVPYGILIYIFQLIILGLSIKNIEHLIKKGPLE